MKPMVLISIIVILIGGIFGNYLRFNEQMPDQPPEFGLVPYTTDDYFGEEKRFSDLSYDVLKADTTTLRRYVGSDGAIYWLFVAYFQSQKYGSQIHSPKHCLPGGGWKIDHIESFSLPLPSGVTKEVNRVFVRTQNTQQLKFYWFETRSGSIREEFGMKWDLMKNSLMLQPTDAAFIRLTLQINNGDVEQATNRAIEFFDNFYSDIKQGLPFNK